MADTIVKDREAAEKALEKRIMNQWYEKEEAEKMEDARRKRALHEKE